MSYIDPTKVIAPKSLVRDVSVVYDSGPTREEGFSVVTLRWDNKDAVGIRWNGDPDDKGIGTPQAFGQPTWFLVPEELREPILDAARKLANGRRDELKAGYEEMARDSEHEREAYEWSEGLMADQANE
jgi:hypothetical protein